MIRQLLLLSTAASIGAFLAPPSLRAADSLAPSWRSSRPLPGSLPASPLYADAEDAAEEKAAEEEAPAPSPGDASDILNSPAFLKRKEEVLKSDVAAMEKEIEEANAVYEAAKEEWGAKFDVLAKEGQLAEERMAKQAVQGTEMATVDVAQKILNVLDNYDRAFQSVEAATNEEVEIVDAYKNTYDMILDAFASLNVTKVETVGTEFNYTYHQAMMQMPSDEYEEGIVCQEFAPGWTCGDKLIRPAMVVVAA